MDPSRAREARLEVAVAAAVFALSGAAALVYQVAWQRILALQSGVGIYSVAMIVAAFMAGLGLGSHAGALWSARLDARRALRAFALVELGVGAFGAASTWLYHDVLYERAAWLYGPPWRAALLHFGQLFLPTFLMGTSLPFLVRAMVREGGTAASTIGVLYGVNLLGAACGSVLAPWVLVRSVGLQGAVWAAAAANVGAGLLALAAGRLPVRRAATRAETPAPTPGVTGDGGPPFRAWVALYAASGFLALSLEILWFRVLELALRPTAFTFGTLLGHYLAGSAAGCLLGARFVHRVKRPLAAFLALQCLIASWAVGGVLVLAHAPPAWEPYAWYFRYWQRGWFALGHAFELEPFLRLYVALPLALYGVPTVLMGFSFPVLQRAVQGDPQASGRAAGLLQAANIGGCVAGSLLMGLLALGHVGTTGAFRLVAALGVGFALVGWRHADRRFAPAVLLLAVLSWSVPGQDTFWRRLHGVSAGTPIILGEDASGVGAVVERSPGTWVVFANGLAHSWVPFGGAHTRMGATPAMVHPAPVDVAIIGLGSGDTAWAAASRAETRSLTVFEISGPQPAILRTLAARPGMTGLRGLLSDPRLRVHVADGRKALEQEDRRYDIIEADALWPMAAYSGNLYSTEFFARCLRRLKPGGLLCTWAPTPRVWRSLAQVADHVVGTRDRSLLIASNQPIPDDHEAWLARVRSAHVRRYLGVERARAVEATLETLEQHEPRFRHKRERNVNRDLWPRDEFATP